MSTTTYETAPATQLLATFCACCGKPLVDADSVEAGIGPDCRKRHGYGKASAEPNWTAANAALGNWEDATAFEAWGSDARAVCNKLVHTIAVAQDGPKVQAATNAIAALGFEKLAARLVKRLAKIQIDATDEGYAVKSPFDMAFVLGARNIGGRWDPQAKAWRFASSVRGGLWTLLQNVYPGATARGPKGLFQVAA